MVSQENKLVGAFVLFALVFLFALGTVTEVGSAGALAVMFVIGVLVPQLLLQYTEYGDER